MSFEERDTKLAPDGSDPLKDFAVNKKLGEIFHPLATTNDLAGRTFIAVIEAINCCHVRDRSGIQERPPYEFTKSTISHDLNTLGVSDYLSMFLPHATDEEQPHLPVSGGPRQAQCVELPVRQSG